MAGLPASRHFTLHRLVGGVYAGIASDGGWAICNAGVIDLGDSSIVFDTFINQQAASDLKSAAELVTGKPVGVVMNSHCHGDHVRGNQVFDGATIVSTGKTREVMIQAKGRYETERETIRKSVQAELEQRAATPDDPDRILFEGYLIGNLEGLRTLAYTLPTVTFDNRMTFHGTKRRAEAITFGGGHTVSDALLYLPEDRIAFMGDLLFVRCHPYLGDGDLSSLFHVLDQVEALDAKVLVPGHGPLGDSHDIDLMRQYISDLQTTVDEVRSYGGGVAQAARKPMGAAYESWRWRNFHRDNMEFFFQSEMRTD